MVLHTPRIDKKGVEMSMQVMVIAALSLMILVVLIVLFTRNAGNFDKTLSSCPGSCQETCDSDEIQHGSGSASCRRDDSDSICCVPREDLLG